MRICEFLGNVGDTLRRSTSICTWHGPIPWSVGIQLCVTAIYRFGGQSSVPRVLEP